MTTNKRVFDAWNNQTLKEALFVAREAIDEGDFTMVERWRETETRKRGRLG